ncbi:hypothetical protein [Rhodococcoides yunnanense]|uniref:PD-(D/E)XK nuclease superfamily protein n=1 Tax=Rhodococcoides yunnanense TaxID=278209 RepID=A0ABU4BIB2_9NOCA|nr:hypothetical protein [Rhodococcus yunnanensis]MDV6263961.1 hypothetical protein [Rhodococcus yunnanensis]
MNNSDEGPAAEQVLVVPGFGDAAHLPALADLGGESILASNPTSETDPDLVYTVALAVSHGWGDLHDRVTAKSWLRAAIPTLEIESLIAFNNVVLASTHAVPDLAEDLAEVWEALSDDRGLLGNVAVEAWTRLALAGWSDSLPVRAVLGKRAKQAAVDTVDADIFLVRSLGAAMDVWPSTETRRALERLSVVESVECDVAFELAMDHVRMAMSVEDVADAAGIFAAANAMFERSNLEGDRPDAVAFAAVTAAVGDFLGGRAVSVEVVEQVRRAAVEWHLGYLGQAPEWRQARAETASSWADVLTDMGRLTDLDEPWLHASALLSSVGELLANHQATALVANPRTFATTFGVSIPLALASATDGPIVGLPVSFAPRIESAFTRNEESLRLVDRWLGAMSARTEGRDRPDVIDAVEGVRNCIRNRPPPGKVDASRHIPLPRRVREALEPLLDGGQLDSLGDILAEFVHDADEHVVMAAAAGLRVVPLREEQLLNELTHQLDAVLPGEYKIWSIHVTQLLSGLIRAVSIAIDREQGGKRNLPWHRPPGKGNPPEADLADFLAMSIHISAGLRAHVEIPNIGGGRADVVVPIGTEQFVIEVKRVTATRTDEALTTEYGLQASEYTKTGAPFSFLAVLDLKRRTSRLDIGDSFWISEWKDASGRMRALTGLRVLGKVSSPSAAT